MSVREAKQADRFAVAQLVLDALIEEHTRDGSTTLPTPKSASFYLDYFNSYTSGSRFGVCLLWQLQGEHPSGFILAGEPWEGATVESELGRTAEVWNLYVDPKGRRAGAATHLMVGAVAWAREAGFQTMSYRIIPGGSSEPMRQRFGAVPRGVCYTTDLSSVKEYPDG